MIAKHGYVTRGTMLWEANVLFCGKTGSITSRVLGNARCGVIDAKILGDNEAAFCL